MRSEVASFADVVRLADLVDDGVLVINDGYRAKNAELGSEGLPFVRRSLSSSVRRFALEFSEWRPPSVAAC